MPVKVRRSQLEAMPRGMALQWCKKINPAQCDDPEWVKDVRSGKIKLESKQADIDFKKQLLENLKEKQKAFHDNKNSKNQTC